MRRTLPLLLAVSLSLLLAAPASADLSDRLVADYSADGVLDACKYTQGELGEAKDLIASDTDAYAPDFRNAVDAMIERRTRGACEKNKQGGGSTGDDGSGAVATLGSANNGSSGTPSGPAANNPAAPRAPGTAGAVPGPEQTPTPTPLIGTDSIGAAARSGEEGGAPPFPLLAIAVLLALLALCGIVFGVARWTGWEPAWADRARHATAEAGWRASSTWAEFTDFVRFGR